jgi:ABC-type nitrate/sulfonate/bicarbonate transport system substrate-binding protein
MTVRNRKFRRLGRFALAIIILIYGGHAFAEVRIRAAYSSISGIFTPVWIASDLRLYQKHQTDADLVYIGGSAVAVSALIAGEIDFIYGGADPIIAGILGGADLTLPRLYPSGLLAWRSQRRRRD